MKIHQSIQIASLGLASILTLHAAEYEFDNTDGNRLFSGVNNWNYTAGSPAGTFPVTNDVLRINNSLFTTTAVAPALVDSAWAVTGSNTHVAGAFNTAYVTVQAGGHFRSSNFFIGSPETAANAGFVTIENGGRISSNTLLNGSLLVGGTSVQSAGTLVLRAGAITTNLPNFNLGSNGTLQFVANTSGFGNTTMALNGSSTWAMNGKLSLDLTSLSLASPTTFVLIDHVGGTPVSMSGSLATWLASGPTAGTQTVSGSGSFGSGAFEVIGWSGNLDLAYDSATHALSVTAVPEPSTWALLAGGLTAVMLLRRRKPSSLR